MKYYFSGINHWKSDDIKRQVVAACPWRLQSCYPKYMASTRQWCEWAAEFEPGKIELMFDSGAFTAWNKGEVVKVDELCKYYDELISKYESKLKAVWLISLDVIPGSRGVTAGVDEIEEAVRVSDINFEILQKRYGARVLPVYHQNEPAERLQVVAQQASYICISPRNDLPERGRIAWSVEAHKLLPPSIKTHGLATTGRNMLTRVPWYSADSASWVFCGANGGIMVLADNKFKIISISSMNSKSQQADGHYDTLPVDMQRVIEARVAHHGITIEQLRDPKGYGWRMIFNAREIVEFCKTIDPATMAPVSEGGLFNL